MINLITEINGQDTLLNARDYLFRKDGIIQIYGPIDKDMAMYVNSAAIAHAMTSDSPIILMINSPGGELTSGFSIYDTVRSLNREIYTVASGMAASMGAFLLAALGDKGKRYVQPNAKVLIHQPLGGYSGQATDIAIHTKHILAERERLNTILSEATGKPIHSIAKDTERDNIMTAEESLSYGLSDYVGDPFSGRY